MLQFSRRSGNADIPVVRTIAQFINLATAGSESSTSFAVGHGVRSATREVQESMPFPFEGRTVTLIDTPGFDDTNKTDAEVLQLIVDFLESSWVAMKSLRFCRLIEQQPAGILKAASSTVSSSCTVSLIRASAGSLSAIFGCSVSCAGTQPCAT